MAMTREDRPYAGILMKDGTEISHYGVKGMKWGKNLFGKVKGVFGKPNSMSSQIQNAVSTKETPSSEPVAKQRGGTKVNTVNSNKTGVNLISNANATANRAAINSAQATRQADQSTRQSERSAALKKSSTIKKEKERKKKQSYVDNYNWHHN